MNFQHHLPSPTVPTAKGLLVSFHFLSEDLRQLCKSPQDAAWPFASPGIQDHHSLSTKDKRQCSGTAASCSLDKYVTILGGAVHTSLEVLKTHGRGSDNAPHIFFSVSQSSHSLTPGSYDSIPDKTPSPKSSSQSLLTGKPNYSGHGVVRNSQFPEPGYSAASLSRQEQWRQRGRWKGKW